MTDTDRYHRPCFGVIRFPVFFSGIVAVALMSLVGTFAAAAPTDPPAGPTTSPTAPAHAPDTGDSSAPGFMRVVDLPGKSARLDISVHIYAPRDPSRRGPTVALCGAIHIADPNFYALLQSFLDAQDIVLYESVRPAGIGPYAGDPGDNSAKRTFTRNEMRFLAIMTYRYRKNHHDLPQSLEDLAQALKHSSLTQSQWIDSSMNDGWGRPLQYRLTDDGRISIISYAADGRPGGAGDDADISLSDQEPLSPEERGDTTGIQSQLASALGLVFQLDAMKNLGPNYHNTDMSIDEVERRLAAKGVDPSGLFEALNGSSLTAQFASLLLDFVKQSPRMQAIAKLVLMEATQAFESGDFSRMPGMPSNMSAMMEVILYERNDYVIGRLRQLLDAAHDPSLASSHPDDPLLAQVKPDSTIAIIYGAAHMANMQQRLTTELGYRQIGEFWLPAMSVDLTKTGMSPKEIDSMRNMFRTMMNRKSGK